jgi:hypothetical protein
MSELDFICRHCGVRVSQLFPNDVRGWWHIREDNTSFYLMCFPNSGKHLAEPVPFGCLLILDWEYL